MDPEEKIKKLEELDELLAREREEPAGVDLLVQIGRCYVKLQEFEKANDYYTRALAIDPDDAWTYLYLGNLFYALNLYDDAIAAFSHAAELMPGVACSLWCLGDAYDARGEFKTAEYYYKKAVEVEPDCPQAKENLEDWYKRRFCSE